ncbi:MAG: MerR family transcriptional regulator [Betaproteobacteria bacterium]
MPRTRALEQTFSISAVERETGLSKDTLRMWERRYGFPQPRRDANGERVYPLGQIEKLRSVKRLISLGHRPGKIISRNLADLHALSRAGTSARTVQPDLGVFLELVRTHDLDALKRHLHQTLLKQGLQRFVLDTLAPLNTAIGDAWVRGECAVFEEHRYTETIYALLRGALTAFPCTDRSPTVVLSTLPGETHGLGLLMAEAILAVEGSACICLGTQTPRAELVRAALAYRADIVALSFSAAYGDKQAVAGLRDLRVQLPTGIQIWAGGAAVARVRTPIPGVELFSSLSRLLEDVQRWRLQHVAR